MRKLAPLVISLPLLATPLIFSGASPVNAEVQNIGPTGAVKLLAQSSTADAKCRHLTSTEHSELNDYVAKAEIAAATMASSALAQSARRTGRRLGKSMACGRGSEELVRATLDAARRAMDAALAQQKKRRLATRQPQAQRQQTQKRHRAPGVQSKPVANATSLTRYRRVTEAYYLERRCQHLSRRHAVRFWNKIVSSHKAVLRKYSSSQVSKAKSGAERAARNRGNCGTRTARIVKAGYRG